MKLLSFLAIAALVLLAYSPSLNGDFIWDDEQYVTDNPLLHDLKGLWQIWFDFDATRQYYPLSLTLFWLQFQLWGLNPSGYHLTNALLHALNAVLVWRILVFLQLRGAFFVALAFALHPVQAESVAWIMELKNVLSGAFFLLSLLTFLHFRFGGKAEEDPTPRSPLPRGAGTFCSPFPPWEKGAGGMRSAPWSYLLSLFLFILALLSKSVTCSLPIVILILIFWKEGKVNVQDLVQQIPLLAAGAVLGLLTVWNEVYRVGAQGEEFSLSWLERILLAGKAVWFYIGKIVWPNPIIFIYPRWTIEASDPSLYLYSLALLGVLALTWWFRGRLGNGAFAALTLYLVTMFPALGLFNVYPMRYSWVSDRYQYLAVIPIITLILSIADQGFRRYRVGTRWVRPVLGAVVLVIIGSLTWNQARAFSSMEALWRDTIAKNSSAWVAYNNLGNILLDQERTEEAARAFQQAALANPQSAVICNNLGYTLLQLGRTEEALGELRKAVDLEPGYLKAQMNLGKALMLTGDFESAEQAYRNVLSHSAGDLAAKQGLAWLLAVSPNSSPEQIEESLRLSEELIHKIGPGNPIVSDTLAAAYAAGKRFESAIKAATSALAAAKKAGLSHDRVLEMEQRLRLYEQGVPFRLQGD